MWRVDTNRLQAVKAVVGKALVGWLVKRLQRPSASWRKKTKVFFFHLSAAIEKLLDEVIMFLLGSIIALSAPWFDVIYWAPKTHLNF